MSNFIRKPNQTKASLLVYGLDWFGFSVFVVLVYVRIKKREKEIVILNLNLNVDRHYSRSNFLIFSEKPYLMGSIFLQREVAAFRNNCLQFGSPSPHFFLVCN